MKGWARHKIKFKKGKAPPESTVSVHTHLFLEITS